MTTFGVELHADSNVTIKIAISMGNFFIKFVWIKSTNNHYRKGYANCDFDSV